MRELAVYDGMTCLGYVRVREGGCIALRIVDGRTVQLGTFANRADAAQAVSEAARAPKVAP